MDFTLASAINYTTEHRDVGIICRVLIASWKACRWSTLMSGYQILYFYYFYSSTRCSNFLCSFYLLCAPTSSLISFSLPSPLLLFLLLSLPSLPPLSPSLFPSPLSLTRCALECLGSIYKDQGRIAGSSFPDTVQVLVKLWKMQDYRANILGVLTRLLEGLGPSSSSAHKDIYKCVKSGFGDKVLAVRSASAEVG